MANSRKLGVLASERALSFQEELGLPKAQSDRLLDTLQLFGEGWADEVVGDDPTWTTDLTDDGTPFEFSLSFKGNALEARLLAEPQQAPFDAQSNWLAGLAVNARLRARGAHLDRFDAVESIFAPGPSDARARFAMWHATAVATDGAEKLKVYLNPQVQGPVNAPRLTQKALEILGLSSAWAFLETRLQGAELMYFSLDLEASPSARVKVYLALPDATLPQLEQALQGGRHYATGDASEWVRSVTHHEGPYDARPLLVCWAFDATHAAPRPTLHVPVRSYNASDAEALEGFTRWLPAEQGPPTRSALTRIHGSPLESNLGFISYISFQYDNNIVRPTAYIAPQVFSVGLSESGVLPKRPRTAKTMTMADINAVIADENHLLQAHPFLQRIPRADIEEIRELAAQLTFWIFSFQDVVRLAGSLITHELLASFAQTHMDEDDGHDVWFLNDVARLGVTRDLRWAFAPAQAPVRDVSYRILSEVFQAPCDHARIAVSISLDKIGGSFFALIVERLEAIGHSDGLQFFARSHLEIEAAHEIFDAETEARFERIELTKADYDAAVRTTRRIYAAMAEMADHLDARMDAARLATAAE